MKKILFFCLLIMVTSAVFAQKKRKKPAKKPTSATSGPTRTNTTSPASSLPFELKENKPISKPSKKRKPVQDGYVYTDSLFLDSATSYPKVMLQDVIYTKRVWADIDFRDNGNKIYNSPVTNLTAEIFKAIARGELDLYDNNDENFKKDPISNEPDSAASGRYGKQTSLAEETFIGTTVKEDKNGNMGPALNIDNAEGNTEFFTQNFYKMRLKEDWILDAKRGVFEPRIVGLAIIRKPSTGATAPDSNGNNTAALSSTDMANEAPEIDGQLVGWINFEELRPILQKIKIPNEDNDLEYLTFDDLFAKRLFVYNIVKESSANDKLKEMKINGRQITRKELLEQSDRVKNEMSDFEQNMWEY